MSVPCLFSNIGFSIQIADEKPRWEWKWFTWFHVLHTNCCGPAELFHCHDFCNRRIINEQLKNREFDCWLWTSFYYFRTLRVLAHKTFLECTCLRHPAGLRQDIQIRIIWVRFNKRPLQMVWAVYSKITKDKTGSWTSNKVEGHLHTKEWWEEQLLEFTNRR